MKAFKLYQYPQNTKFRVSAERVVFYTTAKQIRYGVGDSIKFNAALQKVLLALEYEHSLIAMHKKPTISGYSCHCEGFQIQLDKQ